MNSVPDVTANPTPVKDFWTFGYGGRNLPELLEFCKTNNLLLVDARYAPQSRIPQWQRNSLDAKFGARYMWINRFGNMNYRPEDRHKGIRIVDFDAGLTLLRGELEENPFQDWKGFVVMCQCPELQGCHRNTLLSLLQMSGYEWKGEVPHA